MRGDYVEITYKTGQGTEKRKLQAKTVGGSMNISGTDGRSEFITVEVLDKTDKPLETGRFAKSEVVAVVEAWEQVGKKK